jgi:hypothetical protein
MSWSLKAQEGDCSFYIKQSESRKKIRYSSYPLNFNVAESLEVLININDKGMPGHLEIKFDFDDRSGLPVEPGSTLSIKFIDNTTYSIIANTRNIKSSTAYFTLSEANSHRSANNGTNAQDKLLTDKLSKVDIRAFEISADDKKREITITDTKSDIIKKTIHCLLANTEE